MSKVKNASKAAAKGVSKGFFSFLKGFWRNGGQFWALMILCTGVIWNPVLPEYTLFTWFQTNGLLFEVPHLIAYSILTGALFGIYAVTRQAWKSTSIITKIMWLIALAIFGGLMFQTGTITTLGTALNITSWLALTFVIGISSKGSATVFRLFGDRSVNIESDSTE